MKSSRKKDEFPPRSPLWTIAQALLLIVVTLMAYSPIHDNGFIWDDDAYIQTNGQLVWPGGLWRIWTKYNSEPQYYPMTHTTFWVEHQLWGNDPRGYHIDNLLLQMGSALLLWRVLLRLSVPGALVIALIFAVHPVQVESVAWATERKNVLSGFFYFLALWSYLHTTWGRRIWQADGAPARGGQTTIEPAKIEWGWYTASFALFCLALLSKSVTSSLPAAILLLLWWKRGTIRIRDIWPLLPFFAAGLAMGSLTAWMEKTNVGAVGPEFDWITPLDRICIAGHAVWFYLYKLIVPLKLTFIYPQWTINPHQRPWLLLYPLAAIMALAALWLLRRRLGRGPLAAMLFFVGTLFPALGFASVFPMRYSYVADHFQYLAMIGPVILTVAAIAPRVSLPTGDALAIAVIALLVVASYLQTYIYKDSETLWRDTVAKNFYSPMAHNNLAMALRDSGNLNEAEKEYWTTLGIRKDYMDWMGLGDCYSRRENLKKALEYYQVAVQASWDSPYPILHHLTAKPHLSIAVTCDKLSARAASKEQADQYHQQAMKEYQKAIEIDPGYVPALTNYAVDLIADKRFDEAIQQCRQALTYNEFWLEARDEIGTALQGKGDGEGAIRQFQESLRMMPRDPGALVGMSVAMGQKGNYEESRRWALMALQYDPTNASAMVDLGNCDLFERRIDEAIQCFQKVLKMDPYNAMAAQKLQAIRAAQAKSGR